MLPADFPPPDLELVPDVPFSAHGLKLDVLRPRQRAAGDVPAILHLHGGGWPSSGQNLHLSPEIRQRPRRQAAQTTGAKKSRPAKKI